MWACDEGPAPQTLLRSCRCHQVSAASACGFHSSDVHTGFFWMGSFSSKVRSLEAVFHSQAFPLQNLMWSLTSKCHNVLPPTRRQHRGRSQRSNAVHSATESAYFGSLKHCQSGFGNVGIAFVAVAPVAVVLAAVAVFAAAAGCILQCFAVGH